MKELIEQICPPFLWNGLISIKGKVRNNKMAVSPGLGSIASFGSDGITKQDLDLYWDPIMAEILETWGEDHVWKEIKFLLANCEGKVLDIACGTGKTVELLSVFPLLQIYGCDISDLLIQKAIERGIPKEHLVVCDATKTEYENDYFDYAYSIGSLEHFTEDGITQFISECHRITSKNSFHMIPVSRSGKDEGWLKTHQSFYNNSVEWWLNKFNSSYKTVHVIDSQWNDKISVGKWLICKRGE